MNQEIKLPTSFFFSGAGWACSFYIGAYKAMTEIWDYEDLWKLKLIGNSSGGLISFLILNKLKHEDLEKNFFELNKKINKNGINNISLYIDDLIRTFLEDENDYKKFNDKLHLGMIQFPNKYIIKSKFKSNQELIDTLHTTMYIPFYSKYLRKIDNNIYIDGDTLGNYYLIDNTTVTISTWNHKSDVHLNKPLNRIQRYFPNNDNIYKKTLEEGYTNFHKFINNQYSLKRSLRDQNISFIKMIFYTIISILFYFFRYILEIIHNFRNDKE